MLNKNIAFIFSLLFSLSSAISYCQELRLNDLTKKYESEKIVNLDSLSKEAIREKCNNWLLIKYPDTGKKGTFIKTELDKIFIHQVFNPDPDNLWGYTNLKIGFSLTIEFKERKFKYLFTDFYYYSLGDGKVLFESQRFQNYDIMLRNRMLQETNKYVSNTVIEMITYLNDIEINKAW